MTASLRFAYSGVANEPTTLMPRLPMALHHNSHTLNVIGLIDTGAAINLLPYQLGLQLGIVWEDQPILPSIGGSFGKLEARGIEVLASHPELTPSGFVRLVFGWTRAENAPILFGQMNFLMNFNVCFYRNERYFEIQGHSPSGSP